MAFPFPFGFMYSLLSLSLHTESFFTFFFFIVEGMALFHFSLLQLIESVNFSFPSTFTVSYFKNACPGSFFFLAPFLINGFEWKRLLGWRGVSNANFKELQSLVRCCLATHLPVLPLVNKRGE